MLNFNENRITISAFRADNDFATNYNNHKRLVNGLRNGGLITNTVIGYYREDGQTESSQELSVQVVDLSINDLKLVNKLALHFKQDTYLSEDSAGIFLVEPSVEGFEYSDMVHIGTKMVEVTKQELIANGAGTIHGTNCYIVV